jgi:hypothetical protein
MLVKTTTATTILLVHVLMVMWIMDTFPHCLGHVNAQTKGTQPMPVLVRKTRISEDDLLDLQASGLTEETIRANKLYTETDAIRLATLLNQLPDRPPKQIPMFCQSGGLVFPYRTLKGGTDGYVRVKPHAPRIMHGKPAKYEQPAGSSNRPYLPVASLPLLNDGESPVFFPEGEKKGLNDGARLCDS